MRHARCDGACGSQSLEMLERSRQAFRSPALPSPQAHRDDAQHGEPKHQIGLREGTQRLLTGRAGRRDVRAVNRCLTAPRRRGNRQVVHAAGVGVAAGAARVVPRAHRCVRGASGRARAGIRELKIRASARRLRDGAEALTVAATHTVASGPGMRAMGRRVSLRGTCMVGAAFE